MTYPEPSTHDHNAPWNMDFDEETGEWVCSCDDCRRKRREEEREKYYDWDDDEPMKFEDTT